GERKERQKRIPRTGIIPSQNASHVPTVIQRLSFLLPSPRLLSPRATRMRLRAPGPGDLRRSDQKANAEALALLQVLRPGPRAVLLRAGAPPAAVCRRQGAQHQRRPRQQPARRVPPAAQRRGVAGRATAPDGVSPDVLGRPPAARPARRRGRAAAAAGADAQHRDDQRLRGGEVEPAGRADPAVRMGRLAAGAEVRVPPIPARGSGPGDPRRVRRGRRPVRCAVLFLLRPRRLVPPHPGDRVRRDRRRVRHLAAQRHPRLRGPAVGRGTVHVSYAAHASRPEALAVEFGAAASQAHLSVRRPEAGAFLQDL
ncbi:hypothetical protein F4809DRAFT_658528, partial [Biscogniauxia mediterranea]